MERDFLPISREDLLQRGWYYYDFLLITGDAYVDHPSFGTAIISRVLEAEGYRVAILSQPDWHSADAFQALGRLSGTQGGQRLTVALGGFLLEPIGPLAPLEALVQPFALFGVFLVYPVQLGA